MKHTMLSLCKTCLEKLKMKHFHITVQFKMKKLTRQIQNYIGKLNVVESNIELADYSNKTRKLSQLVYFIIQLAEINLPVLSRVQNVNRIKICVDSYF